MPAASQAAMTSSSRLEPPGWIIGRDPSRFGQGNRIGKGKKTRPMPGPNRGLVRPPCGSKSQRNRPAHLPCADAEDHFVFRKQNRVALHMANHAPSELEIGQLFRRWLDSGCDLPVAVLITRIVAGLGKQPPSI